MGGGAADSNSAAATSRPVAPGRGHAGLAEHVLVVHLALGHVRSHEPARGGAASGPHCMQLSLLGSANGVMAARVGGWQNGGRRIGRAVCLQTGPLVHCLVLGRTRLSKLMLGGASERREGAGMLQAVACCC